MVINTKQLSIVWTTTGDWVDILIYPYVKLNSASMEPITIKYDADSFEADVEIETIIGIFNGEPSLRQYLEGVNLEAYNCKEDFYSCIVPSLEMKAPPCKKLDRFTISKKEFWTKGLPEIKFIRADLLSGNKHISIGTAIRLEALKYSRIAVKNAEPWEVPNRFSGLITERW